MRRCEFITLLGVGPLLALSYVLAFAMLMQNPALGQDWPQRPLHIIVAFGPGGTTDVVARIIGQGLQERLRQSVVIENRAGAGGTLATMWWHAQKRMATRWAS
jgi:tripartite-type tricarboxylate transporter receptor subunit TctC